MAAKSTAIEVEMMTTEPQILQQQKQLSKEGEEIIFEGIQECGCKTIGFYICVMVVLVVLTCGVGILIIPCVILKYTCSYVRWELYLTREAVHYIKIERGGLACCANHWVIPFKHITSISLSAGTNDITINIERNKVFQSVTHRHQHWTESKTCLTLRDVANAEEFVAVVKKHMVGR